MKNYKWDGPRTYCHRYPFSWSQGIWFLLIHCLSSLAPHFHHIYSPYSILFHYHSSKMAKNLEKGNNSESNKLRHIYYFMLMFWTKSVIKGPVCALGSGKQDVKLKKPIGCQRLCQEHNWHLFSPSEICILLQHLSEKVGMEQFCWR